jgi:hypothetical protein
MEAKRSYPASDQIIFGSGGGGMREIKFRAWDSVHNRMEDADFVFFQRFRDWQDIKDSGFRLMQYTGLRDADDKEIYEDDIVIDDWFPVDPHPTELPIYGKYKIIYCPPSFICEQVEPARGIKHVLDMDYFSDMKVIGNIYENPGLRAPSTNHVNPNCKDSARCRPHGETGPVEYDRHE